MKKITKNANELSKSEIAQIYNSLDPAIKEEARLAARQIIQDIVNSFSYDQSIDLTIEPATNNTIQKAAKKKED